MKILWNLLCQYNNTYAGFYKYLKEKKVQTEEWTKKKLKPTGILEGKKKEKKKKRKEKVHLTKRRRKKNTHTQTNYW